jgi:hypothetical protein
MVKAEPLDDAGAEILDHHVGLAEEAPEHGEVGLALQVDGKALLAAVDGVEDRRVAPDLLVAEIEPARQVPAVRSLDLDDAGAEVHEPERAIGTGEKLAQVDDDEAGKRQVTHGLPLAHAGDVGRAPVPHRLQVLAVEHELALPLKTS